MVQKIQIRRGLKANLPTLSEGEFGYTTDGKKIYIGSDNGNVLINSISLQNYYGSDIVDYTLPLNPEKVVVLGATKTTLDLSWKPSKSANIKDYTVYVGGVLNGTTTGTTYQVSGLTANTTYQITVKARNQSNVESTGYTINQATNGNFVFTTTSGTPTNQYIESPNITFSMVQADWAITPKTSYWTNGLIQSNTTDLYKISTQFDGIRYVPTNMRLIVDGVEKPLNGSVPVGQRKLHHMQVTSSRVVTDSVDFLSWNNVSSVASTIYRIRFFLINERDQFDLVSDYDFTYSVADGLVQDRMGNNGPLIIRGGTFIAN